MNSIEKQLKELEDFQTDAELKPEFNRKYEECLKYVGMSFASNEISYKDWRGYTERMRQIYTKRKNLIK